MIGLRKKVNKPYKIRREGSFLMALSNRGLYEKISIGNYLDLLKSPIY